MAEEAGISLVLWREDVSLLRADALPERVRYQIVRLVAWISDVCHSGCPLGRWTATPRTPDTSDVQLWQSIKAPRIVTVCAATILGR
jgi:hypothetical protein